MLKVKKSQPFAFLPTKAHDNDLGYDLYCASDTLLDAGSVTKVNTWICAELPEGYGALLRDRSSVATKSELFVVAGVIDNGYRGEIQVAFYNPHEDAWFKKGDKIAQMILVPTVTFPVVEVEELTDSARGENGFGSSGR